MNLLDQFFLDRQVKEIIDDSIEAVFESFEVRLLQREEEKLEVPKVSELALLKLDTMIHLATISYDGFSCAEEPFEKIDADGEPYPSKIDSWARGMVTTRKVVAEEQVFRRSVPGTTGTPSVSSFRSSVTGKSRTTTGNRSHRSGHSRQSDRDDKVGQIMELENDIDGEFGDFGATGYMFNMLEKQKMRKNKGYHVEQEGVKGEFDLLEEQLAKAAKEARGKKFVLDRYGQTVILGKIEPTNLPPFNASLQAAVKEDTQTRPSKAGIKESGEGDKKKKFVRVAGSRGIEESMFQPNLSLASTLSGVENIQKLNHGVSVKSKVGERAGDPVPENPRRISRKTYLEKTAPIQPSISDLDQTDVYTNTGAYGRQVSSSHNLQKSLKSRDGREMTRSIDSLPEIDPLEGSRRIVNQTVLHDASDEELGLGETSTQGHSPKTKLPRKPNGKQRAVVESIVNSPEGGKPRDRDLVKNMKAVSERKHLAAPPLGAVSGHGLGAYNETSVNNSLISGSIESNSFSSEWFQRRTNK